jgi:hypothetical protein
MGIVFLPEWEKNNTHSGRKTIPILVEKQYPFW